VDGSLPFEFSPGGKGEGASKKGSKVRAFLSIQ